MANYDHYACMGLCGNQFGSWQLEAPFELDVNTPPFENKAKQKCLFDEMIYFQLIWPRPALHIIGAGVDARPLARLADNVGYEVHMFDWRSTLCNQFHFPTAVTFEIGDVDKLIGNKQFSPLDSVIIMTHDFQLDVKLVQRLRKLQLLYLGILGSKKRTQRLIGGEIPNGVHSPVGLSIGADGPEEIAVSIVAELIAVRRRKMI